MKIRQLKVSKYKNVEELDLSFRSELISLLVGRNGLGKSNLIEILALIFRDLDLLDQEEEFTSWAYADGHFEYTIIYECKGLEVQIVCAKEKFEVSKRKVGSEEPFEIVPFADFKAKRQEAYLPSYVIGYYSGENKRIGQIIQAHEALVWQQLKRNEALDSKLRRLFFAEKHHAQMILLTLLLYKDQNGESDFRNKATDLINRFCSFTDLEEVNLVLRQPSWFRRVANQLPVSIENLDENLLGGKNNANPFWGAKGKADQIITYFHTKANAYAGYLDDDRIEKLELKSIDKTALAAGVHDAFGHPGNFFDALESLHQIESIDSLSLKVRARSGDKVFFDFFQLSEGEQQLITVLGLILIAGREDCLFLLDEPDTHLNPIWQREYVKLLADFTLDDQNCHIIVATHSPLIVQAAEEADILLYKFADGKIVVDENNFQIHNWRIDQVLASDYFDFPSTRPPSLDSFMELREKIISNTANTAETDQQLAALQNEFGVLPTGETKDEIEAMRLIKSITDKLKSENDQDSKA